MYAEYANEISEEDLLYEPSERASDIQTFWGRVKRFDAVWAFKLPCAAMILTDAGTQSNLVADFFGVSANKAYKCLELENV